MWRGVIARSIALLFLQDHLASLANGLTATTSSTHYPHPPPLLLPYLPLWASLPSAVFLSLVFIMSFLFFFLTVRRKKNTFYTLFFSELPPLVVDIFFIRLTFGSIRLLLKMHMTGPQTKNAFLKYKLLVTLSIRMIYFLVGFKQVFQNVSVSSCLIKLASLTHKALSQSSE